MRKQSSMLASGGYHAKNTKNVRRLQPAFPVPGHGIFSQLPSFVHQPEYSPHVAQALGATHGRLPFAEQAEPEFIDLLRPIGADADCRYRKGCGCRWFPARIVNDPPAPGNN